MKNFITVGLLLILQINSYSQEGNKLNKAEKYYERYSYFSAIEVFEEISKKDANIYRKLADSYVKVNLPNKAETNYAELVLLDDATHDDVYNYAFILRENKKYEESKVWMNKFHDLEPEDSRGNEFIEKINLIDEITNAKRRFEIVNLDINSKQEDFSPTYFEDNKIVFASSREGTKSIKRKWNWNDLPFLDLYEGKITKENQIDSLTRFDKAFNGKYHDGPACFAKNNTLMVFTRNNYNGVSSDGVNKLKMLYSEKEGSEWSDAKEFEFDDMEYSVGQASLTEDGKTMYFASDMPKGYGGVDLYKVEMSENGEWSKPQNLGAEINTEGNEMFPFIHESGAFFYASNGHVGLGGLDVFMAEINADHVPSKIKNIGEPINSSMDDFGIIFNDDLTKGFFSSNRSGGKGDDDIYSFNVLELIELSPYLIGIAKNNDDKILSGVLVQLIDDNDIVIDEVTTGNDGKYRFSNIEPNKTYRIKGSEGSKLDGRNTITTNDIDFNYQADVVLLNSNPKFENCIAFKNKEYKVHFNASDAVDKQGAPKNYQWVSHDKTVIEEMEFDYIYNRPGTYSMMLNVMDVTTNTIELKEDETIVRIENVNHIEFVNNDTSGVNIPTTFDASVSMLKDQELSYFWWNFGDDSDPILGDEKMEYTYKEVGKYQIKMEVAAGLGDQPRYCIYKNIRIISEEDFKLSNITDKLLAINNENNTSTTNEDGVENSNNANSSSGEGNPTDSNAGIKMKLKGIANSDKKDILSGVSVKLFDKDYKQISETTTDSTGSFEFDVSPNTEYNLIGKKESYDEGRNSKTTNNTDLIYNADLVLLPKQGAVQMLVLEPIYFDLDKYNIRLDAALILDGLVKTMNENPTLVIELGSHTDCRAPNSYNMRLSVNRAKSTVKYVMERISNPSRIYGTGYGETQLVNECECEGKKVTPCTEDQHQENRRSEFKIVKY